MGSDSGFFDLQVNGYGGIDFNKDDLTADELHRACERLDADGVGGIPGDDHHRVDSTACARRLGEPGRAARAGPARQRMIAGLHIEGPFINETAGYRGAHPADAIRPADVDEMQRLLDAGRRADAAS